MQLAPLADLGGKDQLRSVWREARLPSDELRRAQCCVEATGLYSLPVALALHAAKKTTVMVTNPRAIKSFGQALMQRAKTDRTDAEVIRTFCAQMPFTPWQPPRNETLQLQAIMRRVGQLKVMLNQELNRQHAYGYRPQATAWTTANIDAHCTYLQTATDALEQEGLTLIEQHAVLRKSFERLLTIKGIAAFKCNAYFG